MSSNAKQPSWLLIWLSCFLLCPLYTPTHSTPVLPPPQNGREEPLCPHATIAELIRTSPVILKALGARIFTDDDLNDEQNAPNGQNGQNYFLTSATLDATRATKTTSRTTRTTTTTTTRTTSRTTAGATSAWNSKSAAQTGRVGYEFVESGGGGVASSSSARGESILITLTPETIYKGASLLKMTPSAESAARSSSGGGGGGGGGGNSRSGGGGGTSAESAHQYEGQLNATLEPLACFDGNVLKILPTELIAFGKLVTVQQQQQQHDNQHPEHPVQQSDILRISINGLHRWSPQFENHIWKHLGWDDWSDFTVCSVTCGKGVQQRFRRCLLDNPMVNLNMNLNLNAVVDDNDDADEIENDLDVIGDGNVATAVAVDDVDNDAFEEEAEIADELRIGRGKESLSAVSFVVRSLDGTADIEESNDENMFHKSDMKNTLSDVAVTAVNGMPGLSRQWSATTTTITSDNGALEAGAGTLDASTATAEDDEDVMRVFVGNFNESPNETDSSIKNPVDVDMTSHRRAVDAGKKTRRRRQRNKRRKSAKSFSTMFCEGYNIEQRNCNTFECSDDISDLLKFYKKFPMSEDTSAALLPTLMAPPDANAPTTTTDAATPPHADAAAVAAGEVATNVAAAALLVLPSSTPANMGYVRSWRNALNFTLMLTLRVKNDSSSGGGGGGVGGSSRTTATVFSIRNATHNLYLEPCKDGLRLYLERDNTTEMLPVKFNLYDYRWHQVAISIQNGDFISIYVDCSWTNSFVVSKRLFSLPLDADVEIGRGFNGELQQLLVLPDNQERYQCSNRRTSINEVKRYIIDTFIDDYGN